MSGVSGGVGAAATGAATRRTRTSRRIAATVAHASMQVEAVSVQTPRMEGIARAESASDIAYVRARFASADELARTEGAAQIRAWSGTRMPRATYVLPDGELRYARDWWRLFDEAGAIDRVRPLFE